jgi:hypothetical protein
MIFPLKINTFVEVIMFADNINTLVCHGNYDDFKNMLNSVLLHISKWMKANHLMLNVEKTNTVGFTPTTLVQTQ